MKPLDPIAVPLSGTTLIEASAGTGKTYTIATLFVRLLLERRLAVGQILVVTFTRAATAELRDRIRRRLQETIAALDAGGTADDEQLARLLEARAAQGEAARDRTALVQALRDFDEAAICTIHGFCQRTLAEHAFESRSPFELKLIEQQAPLIDEISVDYWARAAYDASPELVHALQAQHIGPEALAKLAAMVMRDPRMPVLPDAPEPVQVPYARFSAARERAAALWARERTRILDALCAADLNRRSHAQDKMRDGWAKQLDGLLRAQPLSLPGCAAQLTEAALVKATRKNGRTPEHDFFAAMTELCASAEAVRAPLQAQTLGLRRGLVDYARAQARERRERKAEHSFDDLLHALRAALEGPGGRALTRRMLERHPAALIDEFQDTDPVQYDIFRSLYAADAACSLFLIGDPKQAIYGFRGADVFAYVQAARGLGRAAYTLDINRRTDRRLVAAVNTLFSRARRPFVFPGIEFSPVRPRPDASEHMSEDEAALQLLLVPAARAGGDATKPVGIGWANEHLPALIAHEIVHLLRSPARLHGRPVLPRDIAVLCRTNAQARETQAALAALSVPTVLDGDSSVFESVTAEELERVLWAVARPADPRKLGAALASAILGVRGAALQRMRSEEAGVEPWLERLSRWNQLWHERGFVQMIHQLLDEAEAQRNLLARAGGQRRLTDLLHLCELLHQAAVQEHLGPLSLLHWLSQMRNDPTARGTLAAESAQVRLEHDEHALRLTTVHRSKGLEYPIVFCPFLWARGGGGSAVSEVSFHDGDDGERMKLDLGSREFDAHKADADREDLAESLRLLYVALTRAKHRCYVVWGRFNTGRSPLAYLLHQDPGAHEPVPTQIESRVKALGEDELRAELQALCEASQGAIGARELRFEVPAAYVASELRSGPLSARVATRALHFAPRMSSFSRLTALEPAHAGAPMQEGADHDTDAQADASGAESGSAPLAFHTLPAGSRTGTLIHSVFEHVDFTRADPEELPREAARLLALYGLPVEDHAGALSDGIARVLSTPLDGGDAPLVLARVPREQCRSELEFTLSTERARERFSPAALAGVFERFGAPAAAPDYPARLRALRALPAADFLKGFIDLVFRDGERFYLVDYKSNRLGAAAADYAPPRLAAAMREHHYFLQYHLYALALHRYLALRLPDYDYARCFGGVYYLFVRGMAPEHVRGTGVFFDRPERALLEALSETLGAAEVAA